MLAAPCVPPTALVAAFRMTANFPQTGLWANFLPSRMRGRLGCFLCAPLQSSDCIIRLGGDADTPLLIGSESSVTPDHSSSSSSSSGSLVELFGSIWLLNTEHQQHAHLWPTYSLTRNPGVPHRPPTPNKQNIFDL